MLEIFVPCLVLLFVLFDELRGSKRMRGCSPHA